MKNALITGGSRGIGAACVRKYRSEGFDVAFLYRSSEQEAEALAEETGARAIQCDVADVDEVRRAVAQAGMLFGQSLHGMSADRPDADADEQDAYGSGCEQGETTIDVLVCNAGISIEGLVQDLTDDEWSRLQGVNLTGVLNTVRAAVPGMISRKSGSIVLMSSMWGRNGASCEAAYSATKAALIGLGQGLAKELGPSGIRVNMVAPGVIDTDMNKGRSPEDWEEILADTPLGRIGKPEEVAELVYFLTSDKAGFITGQTIGIDGGFI